MENWGERGIRKVGERNKKGGSRDEAGRENDIQGGDGRVRRNEGGGWKGKGNEGGINSFLTNLFLCCAIINFY